MVRVLFVCLGNICRSPLGEGILRRMAHERGLDIEVDSAGTSDYHFGELPDPRSRSVGTKRGCEMTMRARQFRPRDFEDFDLIVVMDESNLRTVLRTPGAKAEKVRLARSFDRYATDEAVPDPYYGNTRDFEDVADMLEAACEGIVDEIVASCGPE